MPAPACGALLLALSVSFHLRTAGADRCGGGSNVFTELPENSPHGTLVANLTLSGEPGGSSLQLALSGSDAGWFYLEGRTVRLSVSSGAALDREALESPVLMVALTCTEDGFSPVEYRIIVQVLNENDNRPRFLEDSVLAQNISELAAVHSVVFSAQAEDKDGDTLMYVIDSASADSKYFRIDLPNSGKIVLAKALDFETKRHLEVVVHAVEMNTKERYNSSARIRITVLDGDDQYPQFLPCTFLAHEGTRVCVSPVYTANVTEGEVTEGPLHFLPGSVYAEDGDRELKAAVTYAILAGTDHGRFHIDNVTGAITMLRPAESRTHTPVFSLSVMAWQVNDASKYAVTEARVRVLAANAHPPHFGRAQYQAFAREEPGPAALLLTYGGRALVLQADDADFPDGFNPQVQYSLAPQGNHSQLFCIAPGGLLVARADRLRALQRYALQVIARDAESGETTDTTVGVEVLWPGQAAPADPAEGGQGQGPLDPGVLAGSLGALLLLTAATLGLVVRAMRRRQRHQQAVERAALAIEKHPNVSLKWFQPVNAGKSAPCPGHVYFQNEGYSELGDTPPESAGGWGAHAAPPGKTEPAEAHTARPLANSMGKVHSSPAAPRGAGSAPPEKGAGAATTLPNGQTLEQPGHTEACQEDKAPAERSSAEPGTAASQPAGETKEESPRPGSPEKQAEAGAGSREPEPGLSQPGQDKPQAAAGQGGAGVRAPEPLAASQALPNCTAGEGSSPVRSQSPAPPRAGLEDSSTPTGLPPPAQSRQPEPLPTLPVLEEGREETPEEDAPKPGAPTAQDPLAPLPVSDVRLPATLIQLLEDSIEC
ncbi:protocadherin-15-like [Pelodiscus sinensis]|uniref:protocadherin-15-like n=1 Tax=Pelodiscus sinensis TaxID=13735 RepID=UPI003F6CB05F